MQKGNPSDPLLRQILPVSDELLPYEGFSNDPVGDLSAVRYRGMLQKYQKRILLINTGACAIHCRYCFRRNFPYAQQQLTKQQEVDVLNAIMADNSIEEVILSGGDPLVLSDVNFIRLFNLLGHIPHLKRVRIHTRLPIVLPDRITDALLNVFAGAPKKVIMVVHSNHANEIDHQVAQACQRLSDARVTMLNQSVLLRGVNDSVQALAALSERLFEIDIMPYYVHCLDKANGTGHFDVPQADALTLQSALQNVLPGYLVPKFVVEQVGEGSKTLLSSL
jgi:EF-P beta-lysylation protein EpmB